MRHRQSSHLHTSVSAATFDYGENAFPFYLLGRFPNRQVLAARAAGIFTTLKLLSFVVALGMPAALTLTK